MILILKILLVYDMHSHKLPDFTNVTNIAVGTKAEEIIKHITREILTSWNIGRSWIIWFQYFYRMRSALLKKPFQGLLRAIYCSSFIPKFITQFLSLRCFLSMKKHLNKFARAKKMLYSIYERISRAWLYVNHTFNQ